MKTVKLLSLGLMPSFAILCISIIGCGEAKVIATPSSGTTPNQPSPPPPVVPPASPPSAFIPLSETLFVGDVIVGDWPLVQTAYGDAGVLINCREGGDNCTIGGIAEAFPGGACVTGCSPTPLQMDVANGVKRVVFLMGTFDVLASSACFGGATPYTGWNGQPYSYGDPIGAYQAQIQNAANFYKLSVFVGTIPPINGVPAECAAAVTGFNTELVTMAKANNATVVDFNAAMTTSNDLITTGVLPGVLPNVTGYDVMTQAYTTANQ
jgi:hypothetical protein